MRIFQTKRSIRDIRLLIVEDDEIDQMAYRRNLREGAKPGRLEIASSVSEARALLRDNEFDAVVTDYSLNDGTALDVLEDVGDLPTIIVTGNADQRTAVQGLKAGALDFMVKDDDRAYLASLPGAVESVVHRRAQEREVEMLSHALMNIDDVVFITDEKDAVVFVNQSFTSVMGIARADALGRTREMLGLPHLDSTHADTEIAVRMTGKERLLSLSCSSPPTARNRGTINVWVGRDVTARRQVESELRAANEELTRKRLALEELATRDELTGLFNRRELNRVLAYELLRSDRHRGPVSVLLIDLDHFKKVNDVHGHQAGDDVLRFMGQLLKARLRATDRPGRFGGEEFLVVMPETNAADASILAERLRTAIETSVVTTEKDGAGLELRVTASFGLAARLERETPSQLVARADKALYRAKRLGRNRCVVADLRETTDHGPATEGTG